MWSELFFIPHSSGDSLGILEMFMIECLNSWRSSKCRLEWVCGTGAGAFQSLCLCSHRGSAVTLLSAEPRQNDALMSELKTGISAFLSGECCWMFSSLRRCFQPSKRKGGWFWEQIWFESGILMSSPGQGGFNDSMEALLNAPSTLYSEQASGKPCVIVHRSLDSD